MKNLRPLPLIFFVAALVVALVRPRLAFADPGPADGTEAPMTPPALQDVDVVEHLGGPLPTDARFTDADGRAVKLGDFFDGKRPVLLVFAYHTCPMLCSLVLDGMTKGIRDISWTVGNEYDVVVISIDPHDTPEVAGKKRDQIIKSYGKGEGAKGWHFLVGDETNIRRVTDAVGFQFKYDEAQKQYAHPAAIYLATPGAKLARYLYGIEYEPRDLRFGLLEASEGRSVSIGEKILMFCYQYDPKGKKYALVAMNVMRIGGALTAILLGGFVAILWIRERKKRARAKAEPPNNVKADEGATRARKPAEAP